MIDFYALYTFGAVCGLMDEHDEPCDENRVLAVLVMHFNSLPDIGEQDASYLVNRCIQAQHRPAYAAIISEGRAAARQWSAGQAGQAVERLAAVMTG